MHHDLAARLVIMASYLYYNRHSPVVPDAVFDATCRLVAANWDKLRPILQWQLESREAILAGGSHIKITRLGENAAIALHLDRKNVLPHGTTIPPGRWRWSDQFQCFYATLNG